MKGTALYLLSKSQTITRGPLTKPEYDPHTEQPGLSAPSHQEPHSMVSGSMFITTADGQPSKCVNNKMSFFKKRERESETTAEKASQGGKQNSRYSL